MPHLTELLWGLTAGALSVFVSRANGGRWGARALIAATGVALFGVGRLSVVIAVALAFALAGDLLDGRRIGGLASAAAAAAVAGLPYPNPILHLAAPVIVWLASRTLSLRRPGYDRALPALFVIAVGSAGLVVPDTEVPTVVVAAFAPFAVWWLLVRRSELTTGLATAALSLFALCVSTGAANRELAGWAGFACLGLLLVPGLVGSIGRVRRPTLAVGMLLAVQVGLGLLASRGSLQLDRSWPAALSIGLALVAGLAGALRTRLSMTALPAGTRLLKRGSGRKA